MPHLDLPAGVRLVKLLPGLGAAGLLAAAHDVSIGGIGVALARMVIASGNGARVRLPDEEASLPTAGLFGEAAGRVLVAVDPAKADGMAAGCRAAGVVARRLGEVEGTELRIELADALLSLPGKALASAWETPF
jgi:phosphoribosylformylglycinamidine synthase